MKYKIEANERHERNKHKPTVKRIDKLLMVLDKDIEMGKPVPNSLYGFVTSTRVNVIRDADERKGSGCMTKSSDQVRDAEQRVKQERERYDNNYM